MVERRNSSFCVISGCWHRSDNDKTKVIVVRVYHPGFSFSAAPPWYDNRATKYLFSYMLSSPQLLDRTSAGCKTLRIRGYAGNTTHAVGFLFVFSIYIPRSNTTPYTLHTKLNSPIAHPVLVRTHAQENILKW